MRSLFGELRRRNVLRAGALYIAGIWALAQGIAQLGPSFGMPDWGTRWFVIAACIGFPFWVTFAWFYEFTPEGLKRESEVERHESITHHTARKLDFAIIGILALAVVLLLTNTLVWHKGAGLREGGDVPIPEHSIAVLPFVSISAEKGQDYFSDGLTEEMIELLGRVPELRVPARTSSFYFKGKNEPIASIAQQLKVAYVLEGSVRKSGKRLRITAQLIRADNGYHLWSQSYDRDDSDVFAVQDDIAKSVVSALQLKLEGAEHSALRGTNNAEAYSQFLLGRQLYRRGGVDPTRHAIEAYRHAVALDPNYGVAHAELAFAEAALGDYTGDRGSISRAASDADRAVELAPDEASVYSARGSLRGEWLWDWQGAQSDISKALSLDPRNSDAQMRYAHLLASLGRMTEALAVQKTATTLDPLSSAGWRNLGDLYTASRDYAAADLALGRAVKIDPTSEEALYYLGVLRLLQNDGKAALEEFHKINDDSLRPVGIAMTEHTLGHAKESQEALDEVIAKHAQDYAYQIAGVFSWRRDPEHAFAWLERAYLQRDGGLSRIKFDPTLDPLRADPRFAALVHKMGLPE